MTLLLTLLSVVAGLAFLSLLVLGLLFIFKPLESVRRSLRQIAMGVRAIEHQTRPLASRARALEEGLSQAGASTARAARRVAATAAHPTGKGSA